MSGALTEGMFDLFLESRIPDCIAAVRRSSDHARQLGVEVGGFVARGSWFGEPQVCNAMPLPLSRVTYHVSRSFHPSLIHPSHLHCPSTIPHSPFPIPCSSRRRELEQLLAGLRSAA
jgi:hypothetical protein